MSQTNSKPERYAPLLVHFVGKDKERLKQLAEIEGRSLSNMAAKFIRDGMKSLERQHEQAQQSS